MKKASTNAKAKLTEKEIKEIVRLYSYRGYLKATAEFYKEKAKKCVKRRSLFTHIALAKRFNVKKSTINNVLKGYTYKHINRS